MSVTVRQSGPVRALTRSVCVALAIVVTAGTPAEAGFIFEDFADVSGLRLNGRAAQSGNALRLITNSFFATGSGSAFTTASTPLGNLNSFSTYFRFRITDSSGITDPDGIGADGLVFVIQTQSNNVGGGGGGLGYQGITPSLGIEFDTFFNGGTDPNGNHVGIDLNGNVFSVATAAEPIRFNNGQIWNAWVDYNGLTDGLEVRWSLSATRPTASQLTRTVNLQALLGRNDAFLGFTAGTAAGQGNHDILSWEYRDSFDPIGPPTSSTPVPSAAVVFGLGLACLGRVAARRRTDTRRHG